MVKAALFWGTCTLCTVCVSAGCNSSEPTQDELLEALHGATSVEVAALIDDTAGEIDAGPGTGEQFHGHPLASDFVDLTGQSKDEVLQILSSADSYMGTPNACHDRDIAMRVVASDNRQIDVTIGLVCNNIGFLVEGESEGKYLNEEELQRLTDLAHEAVPEIDVDQARD
jgi:hypothetical protein